MMILVTSCRWTGIRAGSGTVWDGMPYRYFVGGLAANHTTTFLSEKHQTNTDDNAYMIICKLMS